MPNPATPVPATVDEPGRVLRLARPGGPPLDLVAEWMAWQTARGLRPNTVKARYWVLQMLRRDLGDPTTVDRGELFRWWASRGSTPQTRATYRQHLRSFYSWAVEHGHTAHNPADVLPAVKVPQRLPRPFTPEQLRLAVGTADEPVRSWLLLSGYAGLRAAEIAALHGEDLDRHRMVIEVRDPKGGGVGQVAPLHPDLAEHLAAHYAPRGLVFGYYSTDGTRHPYRAVTVSSRANRHLKVALGDPGATLHQCRHTFATRLLRQTGDVRLVQTALRHASLNSTMIYTKVDPADMTGAVAAMAWVDE